MLSRRVQTTLSIVYFGYRKTPLDGFLKFFFLRSSSPNPGPEHRSCHPAPVEPAFGQDRPVGEPDDRHPRMELVGQVGPRIDVDPLNPHPEDRGDLAYQGLGFPTESAAGSGEEFD